MALFYFVAFLPIFFVFLGAIDGVMNFMFEFFDFIAQRLGKWFTG